MRRSLERVMWSADGLPGDLLESLWTDPDHLLASGTMLKDGDRCTVVRIEHHSRSCTLKRYNLKGKVHTALHWLLRSRARWSWLNARTLIAGGLPVPMPLAMIEERCHGVLKLRSWLLSEFITGRSLLDLVQSGEMHGKGIADAASQFARIWRTLGQLRAGHGDMKATNFIVDAAGKLWLIDLDGVRTYRSATLLRRERRNDLARFMRNWEQHPEVAAVFRARIGTG